MSVVAAVWDLKVPSLPSRAADTHSAALSLGSPPSSQPQLQLSASPRSLCVSNPHDFQPPSTNPFDHASSAASASATTTATNDGGSSSASSASSSSSTLLPSALVFGTDAGTLHYRTYAPPLPFQKQISQWKSASSSSSSSAATGSGGVGSHASQSQPSQLPLGVAGPTSRPSPQLPRWYYPADGTPKGLATGSSSTAGAGAMVACLPLRDLSGATRATQFLVLVDDSGGSGSAPSSGAAHSSGSYAAHVVSLTSGAFQLVSTLGAATPNLPRMSCAVVAPAHHPAAAAAAASSHHQHHPAYYSARAGPVSGAMASAAVYYASGRTVGRLTAYDVDAYTSSHPASNRPFRNQPTPQQQQQQPQSQPSRLLLHAAGKRTLTPAPQSSSHAAGGNLQRHDVATGLPSPGVRGGPHALCVTVSAPSAIHVAVVAVGNAFYAVNLTSCLTRTAASNSSSAAPHSPSQLAQHRTAGSSSATVTTKILALQASYSQVYPVICHDVQDPTVDDDWTTVLLANGRECAVVDLYAAPDDVLLLESVATPRSAGGGGRSGSAPLAKVRGGGGSSATTGGHHAATTSAAAGIAVMPSPILACAAAWPWIAILTSDGLVTIRSPSCLSVPIRQVEVGRPNDYFELQWLHPPTHASAMVGMPQSSSSSSSDQQHHRHCSLVAVAFSGEGKVVSVDGDTSQDLADRLMRLCIDALGANGFPRTEVAQAVNASFTATSHVGIVTTENSSTLLQARSVLVQYLEAVLSLTDWASGAAPGWPVEHSSPFQQSHHPSFQGGFTELEESAVQQHSRTRYSGRSASASTGRSSRPHLPPVVDERNPAMLLTCTALLCLVSMQVSPPQSGIANRAAKSCSDRLGVVLLDDGPSSEGGTSAGEPSSTYSTPTLAAARVCQLVVEKLLRDAASLVTLLSGSSSSTSQPILARGQRTSQAALYSEFVESCVWLLRACGKHDRAIEVAYERLQRQPAFASDSGSPGSGISPSIMRGGWSTIKYESYTATHLSELWASGTEAGCRIVLQSSATHRLLQHNPRLGLSVFCSSHPQNEAQWRAISARDDPIASNPDLAKRVLLLLRTIQPSVPYSGNDPSPSTALESSHDGQSLPLDSGRALSVFFLESALGVATGRPTEWDEFDSLPPERELEERVADFHDELALLLLEGVISERRDDESGDRDTELGSLYRNKLRRFLRWPLAKLRPDQFTSALPPSFLHEKALMLGRLGRHEDALRILYKDLNDLDLALEYCDARHEQLKAREGRHRTRQSRQAGIFDDHELFDSGNEDDDDNAYLPLVRVALESEDAQLGTAAAIQVLALRRSAIDRAAALRLLPSDVPVSAVARPFLIPALVDSESQVRRLTVVSSLLRARYIRLKDQLTTAQLKAQSNLHVVPQLRSLNLGDPLHSTNPFRARTSAQASSSMPDVWIVKHFFPRHLVIQVKVTNSVGLNAKYARTLSDIAFVVAESSEEAIQPLIQVPIQVLPPKKTGCAWCVLAAASARMEGPTALLTCELRYTVQSVEVSSGMTIPVMPGVTTGRTYVEELQDLEVHASHFS